MKFFKNISLKKKITIGFMIPLVMIAIFGVYSYFSLTKTANSMALIKNQNMKLAMEAQKMLLYTKSIQEIYIDISLTGGDGEDPYKEVNANVMKLNKNLSEFSDFYKTKNKHIFGLIGMIDSNVKKFTKAGKQMSSVYLKAALLDGEEKNIQLGKAYKLMKSFDKTSEMLNMFLAPFVEDQVSRLNKSLDLNSKNIKKFNNKFFAVLPICFAFAIFMIFMINKILNGHFNLLKDFSEKMGTGDLRAKINTDARDETGMIAREINGAISKLQMMILDILNSSDKLSVSSSHMNKVSDLLNKSTETLSFKSNEVSAASEEMIATNQGVATSIKSASEDIGQASIQSEKISKDMVIFENKLHDNSDEILHVLESLKSMANDFENFLTNVEQNAKAVGSIGESSHTIKDNNNIVFKQATHSLKSVKNVASHIDEMNNSFSEIVGISQDTHKNVEDMNNSIGSVSNEVGSIVKQIQGNTKETEVVINTLETLSGSINQVSVHMENTSNVVTKATDLSKESLVSVKSLVKAAEEVNEVITFIEEIARQTTLLSLNASIEASRAGEAGKGFAVVANEVKELAQNTHDKTDEIRSSINSIKKLATDVDTKIRNSEKVVLEINEATHEVSNTIEQQVNLTKKVDTAINTMKKNTDIVLENATKTENISNDVLAKGEILNQNMKTVVNYITDFSAKTKEMKSNITTIEIESQKVATVSSEAVEQVEKVAGEIGQVITSQNEMKEKIIFFARSSKELSSSLGTVTEGVIELGESLNSLGKVMINTSNNFNEISSTSIRNGKDVDDVLKVSKDVSKHMFQVNDISTTNSKNANAITEETEVLSQVVINLKENLDYFEIPETISSEKLINLKYYVQKSTDLNWEQIVDTFNYDLHIPVLGRLYYKESYDTICNHISSNTEISLQELEAKISVNYKDNIVEESDNSIKIDSKKKEESQEFKIAS